MNPTRSILSLLLGLTTSFCLGQEQPTHDLIIVSGQSNAVGYNAIPSELPENKADDKILFWFRCGDPPPDQHDSIGGTWGTLRTQPIGNPMSKPAKTPRQYGNFAQKEGGFGPEFGLARILEAKKSDRKIAVLKVAFSGTGIRKDWNPNSDQADGACYRALISEFKKAKEAAAKDGVIFRVRAFAWVQGESDANAKDAPKYEDALLQMVASLRKDLEAPELMALVAVNTRFGGGNNAFISKIVEAQKAASERDSRMSYVDTSKAPIANNAHYDTEGTLLAGDRWPDNFS